MNKNASALAELWTASLVNPEQVCRGALIAAQGATAQRFPPAVAGTRLRLQDCTPERRRRPEGERQGWRGSIG
jgi:hypothetical protein